MKGLDKLKEGDILYINTDNIEPETVIVYVNHAGDFKPYNGQVVRVYTEWRPSRYFEVSGEGIMEFENLDDNFVFQIIYIPGTECYLFSKPIKRIRNADI